MAKPKAFIFTAKDPITEESLTILISRRKYHEDVPTIYYVESLDGKYETPSAFDKAIDESRDDEFDCRIYNIFILDENGIDALIDHLQRLRGDSE